MILTKMSELRTNLWRYPLFQALVWTPFVVPVIVLFWRANGLDAMDIYVLQGIFAVAVVILEVPTGTIADRLGKKASMLAGCALLAMGHVVYALSSTFAGFFAAEVVLAVAVTLVSGADSAFLYDTLKHVGRAHSIALFPRLARLPDTLSS